MGPSQLYAASDPTYDEAVREASKRHGVDERIIRAIIAQESGGNPAAKSPKGATGLMQLMPGTASELGVDPLNPSQNIEGGTRYFKRMRDQFGTIEKALAAYNAGPGNVLKYGGVPPFSETRKYVKNVMAALGDENNVSPPKTPASPSQRKVERMERRMERKIGMRPPRALTPSEIYERSESGRTWEDFVVPPSPPPSAPTPARSWLDWGDVWRGIKYGVMGEGGLPAAISEASRESREALSRELEARQTERYPFGPPEAIMSSGMTLSEQQKRAAETPGPFEYDVSKYSPPETFAGEVAGMVLGVVPDLPIMMPVGMLTPGPPEGKLAAAFAAPALVKGGLRGDEPSQIAKDVAGAALTGAAVGAASRLPSLAAPVAEAAALSLVPPLYHEGRLPTAAEVAASVPLVAGFHGARKLLGRGKRSPAPEAQAQAPPAQAPPAQAPSAPPKVVPPIEAAKANMDQAKAAYDAARQRAAAAPYDISASVAMTEAQLAYEKAARQYNKMVTGGEKPLAVPKSEGSEVARRLAQAERAVGNARESLEKARKRLEKHPENQALKDRVKNAEDRLKKAEEHLETLKEKTPQQAAKLREAEEGLQAAIKRRSLGEATETEYQRAVQARDEALRELRLQEARTRAEDALQELEAAKEQFAMEFPEVSDAARQRLAEAEREYNKVLGEVERLLPPEPSEAELRLAVPVGEVVPVTRKSRYPRSIEEDPKAQETMRLHQAFEAWTEAVKDLERLRRKRGVTEEDMQAARDRVDALRQEYERLSEERKASRPPTLEQAEAGDLDAKTRFLKWLIDEFERGRTEQRGSAINPFDPEIYAKILSQLDELWVRAKGDARQFAVSAFARWDKSVLPYVAQYWEDKAKTQRKEVGHAIETRIVPQDRVEEHPRVDEERQTAEAGRGDRVETEPQPKEEPVSGETVPQRGLEIEAARRLIEEGDRPGMSQEEVRAILDRASAERERLYKLDQEISEVERALDRAKSGSAKRQKLKQKLDELIDERTKETAGHLPKSVVSDARLANAYYSGNDLTKLLILGNELLRPESASRYRNALIDIADAELRKRGIVMPRNEIENLVASHPRDYFEMESFGDTLARRAAVQIRANKAQELLDGLLKEAGGDIGPFSRELPSLYDRLKFLRTDKDAAEFERDVRDLFDRVKREREKSEPKRERKPAREVEAGDDLVAAIEREMEQAPSISESSGERVAFVTRDGRRLTADYTKEALETLAKAVKKPKSMPRKPSFDQTREAKDIADDAARAYGDATRAYQSLHRQITEFEAAGEPVPKLARAVLEHLGFLKSQEQKQKKSQERKQKKSQEQKQEGAREELGAALNPFALLFGKKKPDPREELKRRGVTTEERGKIYGFGPRFEEAKRRAREGMAPVLDAILTPVQAVRSPKAKELAERLGQEASHGIGMSYEKRSEIRQAEASVPVRDKPLVFRALEVLREGDPAKVAALKPAVREAAQTILDYYDEVLPRIKESKRLEIRNRHEGTRIGKALNDVLEEGLDVKQAARKHKTNARELANLVRDYHAIDNWGKRDYFSRIELGQWIIKGKDRAGNEHLIGWGESPESAWAKAERRLRGNSDIVEVVVDNETHGMLGELKAVDSTAYRAAYTEVAKAIKQAAAGLTTREARRKAREALGRAVSIKPSRKFAEPLRESKGILEGETEDAFAALSRYISVVERAISINPEIARIKRYIAKLPPEEARYLERLAKDAKGLYTWEDRMFNAVLAALKGEKDRAGRPFSTMMSLPSEMVSRFRLSLRAVGTAINTIGGTMNVLAGVRHNPRWLMEGIRLRWTPEGQELIKRNKHRIGAGTTGAAEATTGETALSALVTGTRAIRAGNIKIGALEYIGALDPIRTFTAPEAFMRTSGLLANYAYLKNRFPDLSPAELEYRAVRAARVQLGVYDIANMPQLVRASTSVRAAFKFKQYLVNQFRFLTELYNESPRDFAMTLALGGMVAGPSFYVAFLKSVPVLSAVVDWDVVDQEMTGLLGDAYRGAAGAVGGIDVTAPFTPQLPSKLEDFVGPVWGDLIRSAKLIGDTVNAKVKGETPPSERDLDAFFDQTIVIYKHLSDLMEAQQDKQGWVRDAEGNKRFQLIGPKQYLKLLGAKTTEESRRQVMERAETSRSKKVEEEKRRLFGKISDELRLSGRISGESRKRLRELGVSPAALKRALISRELPPELRRLRSEELMRRPDIMKRYKEVVGDSVFNEEEQ